MLDMKIKASRGLLEIEALDHTGKRVGTINDVAEDPDTYAEEEQ